MIQRTAIQRLIDWKQSTVHKPLIIRGARQVGKTTLVEQFSHYFDKYLYLNLDLARDRALFDEEDISVLVDKIHIHCKKTKSNGSTLLFIDEIQNSPKAVGRLRYFKEQVPQLHVIAAGSLLESLIESHISFPVGRVEYMALRPCSFVEFLQGIGEDFDAEVVKSLQAEAIHERLMNHFLNYVVVGGMPEAIMTYAQQRDILAVNNVYNTFINAYTDDVQKYAPNVTLAKVIRFILTNGWSLAAERISFNLFAGSNYRSREVGEALRIIERALLLELSYPVTNGQIPMLPNQRLRPKLLWLDTGLVNYCTGVRSDIFNVNDIMSAWKGRVAEHIVAQELIAENFNFGIRRCFWVREKSGSSAKVDFVMQFGNNVIPIEVKSGHNSKLKSLHMFMDNVGHDLAVRVWIGPFSIDSVVTAGGKPFRLINIPFYYVGQLNKILQRLL